MATDQVGEAPKGAGSGSLARQVADLVPSLVDSLLTARPGSVHRAATRLFERPLFSHVLALTNGNQLQAARLLGLNRNTLRKRCRELDLPLPRAARGPGSRPAPVPSTRRP